jgi:putative ATP-dependent endonuclease of the OLD family
LASRHEPSGAIDVTVIEEDLDARIEALQREREASSELAKEIREELDARWADKRLDIVPGEELLKKLFGRYGLGYKKERDGIGLAGRLRKEEVHGDLKRIIQEACAS